MQFRILGPVEVWDNAQRLELGGPQQRALLATLLLNANRVVSTDRLIDVLWGEQPPPSARYLLHGCIARLRRTLRQHRPADAPVPLVTRPPGYLLEVAPHALDLHRLDELEVDAGSPATTVERAAVLLREALALWRGPSLDGLTMGRCQAYATQLDERRLALLERRVDADLRLGRHAALDAELAGHVRNHPLRERLWAQLMLALHGADRPADALAAFQRLRRLLVEEFGMEPSDSLQRVQQAILTGADAFAVYRRAYDDAAPSADDAPARSEPPAGAALSGLVPAQLPASVGSFTGRADELAELDRCLAEARPDQATAVVVTAIAGTAGVGKTALAVHWAHRVRHHFPGGQLYVNLQGYAPGPPVRALDALAGFLYALGVPPEQVPAQVDQAATLYRSLLADKLVLVTLDNAGSAEQVRPLLPGGPGCLVLVTSRDRLTGLVARDGARRVTLDVLTVEESQALLARVLGSDRVAAESSAAAELARACACLPLALRIAAASLTGRPAWRIADFAVELASGDRLAALRVGDDESTAVAAAFHLSYTGMSDPARRLFRLLGLLPGNDVTAAAAAALAGCPIVDAAMLLEELAAAHLLAEHRPRRYTFHDLLRAYANQRGGAEDNEDERHAATMRLYDWYLETVGAAAQVLYPEKLRLPRSRDRGIRPVVFDGPAHALAWLDGERANLVAAIRHAANWGPFEFAWLLADALRGYFMLGTYLVDWLAAGAAGLNAAQDAGDLAGQAAAHICIGDARYFSGELPRAITSYTRGAALSRQIGWLEGQSAALGNLGNAHHQLGHLRKAADAYTETLRFNRETGRLAGQAISLGNLGVIHAELGNLAEGAENQAQALALYRKIGSASGEALALSNLGDLQHEFGQFDHALDYLDQAVVLLRELGDHVGESDALRLIAEIHRDAGRYAEARQNAHTALELAREAGDRQTETEALNSLATVDADLGQHAQAVDQHQQALRLATEDQGRYAQVVALIGIATAHRRAGRLELALDHAQRGQETAHQTGYGVLEGLAHTALADIYLGLDRPGQALGYARLARTILRDAGHRLGHARALLAIGHAEHRTGDLDGAARHWQRALDLFADIGAPEADEVRRLLAGFP